MPKKAKEQALADLDEFVNRMATAGLAATRETWGDDDDDDEPGYVAVELPNGPNTRRVIIAPDDLEALADVALDKITMLGELSAFLDRTTGVIEARVIQPGPAGLSRPPLLDRLPFRQDEQAEAEATEVEEVRPESANQRRPLVLRDGDNWLEIGTGSQLAAILLPGPGPGPRSIPTIRLHGYKGDRHDEALRMLEDVAGALFFDMDVLYNVSLQLAGRRSISRRLTRKRSTEPPKYPANKYQEKALALYRYGRAAQGLPLLEFLAYYQALEFFFPAFSHAETSFAMRTLLLDPRLNPANDADVSRLIRTAAPAVRVGIGEREQLKSTLRSVVQISDLREVIEELDARDSHFTAKKQMITGTQPLTLSRDDLREQLAERIYAIRCRIVHSKDGGANAEELLLPTSNEAGRLSPDIALMRYIAQQAIIAQAQR